MSARENDYDRYLGILREPAPPGTDRLRAHLLGDLPHTVLDEDVRTTLRTAQRGNRRQHSDVCERCVPGGASLPRAHFSQAPSREGAPCDTD
ncbi:hypothetical protein ACQEVS_00425 [Streptomyces sp. CA-181903]|uniref:hypothetical protein n=1 Tax=Streptomyces sp. CA-181903 TaxID=3240055 RepID=UPI003D92B5E7